MVGERPLPCLLLGTAPCRAIATDLFAGSVLSGKVSRFRRGPRPAVSCLDTCGPESPTSEVASPVALRPCGGGHDRPAHRTGLRVILGLGHGALADLLGQARKSGLFGDPQAARLKKVVTGFSALADMRNEESDAHGNSTNAATAWLALHWAGALVVYLVQRAEAEGL